MNDLYLNKYRIPSTRLNNWDYSSNGLYFVTICTKDKIPYFGDIERCLETQNILNQCGPETQNIASLRQTQIGNIAQNHWLEIPKHFDFIELNDFVLMPDHLHGILYINKPDQESWQTNAFGVQSQNLASVIRGYKASVKGFATKNNIDFQWQPRYHDRIIRSEEEYQNIQQYIYENPERWMAKQSPP